MPGAKGKTPCFIMRKQQVILLFARKAETKLAARSGDITSDTYIAVGIWIICCNNCSKHSKMDYTHKRDITSMLHHNACHIGNPKTPALC